MYDPCKHFIHPASTLGMTKITHGKIREQNQRKMHSPDSSYSQVTQLLLRYYIGECTSLLFKAIYFKFF